MKICRYSFEKKHGWGVFDTDNSIIIPIKGNIFEDFELEEKSIPSKEVRLLPPVIPNKIICIGLNYRDHAEELGMPIPEEPVLFLKPPTTIIGHGDTIVAPSFTKRVDYEAELGVVISKISKNVSIEEAKECILGYTCVNDVTERYFQNKDGQWTRAKSFDTFFPIGPWIETDIDWKGLGIKAYLNGELKQNSTTSNMIFSVEEIISFVSKIMTLFPGDIIATGTPPGVGEMKDGDEIVIQIDGIGALKNYFVKEK
ncbi:MAG: fumarylacetoacetate hydrolase family protein [Brevinematales bacterium]|nr:fumarylacetoacetate hydrolase family protein [Brevinematales bacterium]